MSYKCDTKEGRREGEREGTGKEGGNVLVCHSFRRRSSKMCSLNRQREEALPAMPLMPDGRGRTDGGGISGGRKTLVKIDAVRTAAADDI